MISPYTTFDNSSRHSLGVKSCVHAPNQEFRVEVFRCHVACPVLPPDGEINHDRLQGSARVGHQITLPATLRRGAAFDDSSMFELGQALRERTRRHARQTPVDFVEPLTTVHDEAARDEYGPTLAEDFDGKRERAVLAIATHHGSIIPKKKR